MDLRDAIAKLCEVEKDIEIEEPVALKVKRVWPYMPPGEQVLTADLPCFMHGWQFQPEVRRPNAAREIQYVIHIQLAVGPMNAEADKWSEVATAFHQAILATFDANLKLSDTAVHLHNFRGGEPTLARLEWGGQAYVGLDYLIDLKINDVTHVGP